MRTRKQKGGVYNPFTGDDYNLRKKFYKSVRRWTGHDTINHIDEPPFNFEGEQNTPIEAESTAASPTASPTAEPTAEPTAGGKRRSHKAKKTKKRRAKKSRKTRKSRR